MSKFGFVRRLAIPQGEAGWRWMDLPELGPDCAILVANATEDNKAMLEKALELADAGGRGRRASSTTLATLAKAEEGDRIILCEVLIKGWRGSAFCEADEHGEVRKDAAGNLVPIECTPENRRDFVDQCPAWLLREIRDWCKNPLNFTAAVRTMPNGEDLGNG